MLRCSTPRWKPRPALLLGAIAALMAALALVGELVRETWSAGLVGGWAAALGFGVAAALLARRERASMAARARHLEAVLSRIDGVAFSGFADARRTMVAMSPGVVELCGLAPVALRLDAGSGAIAWADHIHPGDRERAAAQLARAIRAREPYELEYRILHGPAREERWVLERGAVSTAAGAAPTPRVEGLILDVEKRAQIEMALSERIVVTGLSGEVTSLLNRGEDLRRTLEAACQTLVAWLDAASAGIWIFQPSEEVLVLEASAGPEARRGGDDARLLLGQGKVGQVAKERKALVDDAGAAFAGYPLLQGDRLLGVVAIQARGPLAESALKALDAVSEALALGVARVQSQKALETAKEAAELLASEAQATSRAKSEFLAVVSHEIRTPMNGVLGMCQLLLDSPLGAQQRESLEIMQRSGQALVSIINDILDYTKIEAGVLEIESIPFDLAAVAADVVGLLSAKAKEKGLELEHRYEPRLERRFIGDAGRLRQVLLNLTANAIKFTERGQVRVRLAPDDEGASSTGRPDRAALMIQVEDSGIGLSTEQQKRLFKAFSQADSSTTRKYGGSGLGLAISKRVVEGMGGSIGVASAEGKGSTFWVKLSLAVDRSAPPTPAPEPAAAVPKPSARAAAVSSSGQRHVLLVEDNLVNQKVALRMLQKLGCQVDNATDGREALEKAEATRYDAILMDCHMPVMDGYAATRQIRASNGASRNTPIIALSANALVSDRQACEEAGMNAFIGKPVNYTELRELLDRYAGASA